MNFNGIVYGYGYRIRLHHSVTYTIFSVIISATWIGWDNFFAFSLLSRLAIDAVRTTYFEENFNLKRFERTKLFVRNNTPKNLFFLIVSFKVRARTRFQPIRSVFAAFSFIKRVISLVDLERPNLLRWILWYWGNFFSDTSSAKISLPFTLDVHKWPHKLHFFFSPF